MKKRVEVRKNQFTGYSKFQNNNAPVNEVNSNMKDQLAKLKISKKLLFPDKLRNRPGLSIPTLNKITNINTIIKIGNKINLNYKLMILNDLSILTPSLIQSAFIKAFDCIYQFKSKHFEETNTFLICSEIIRIFLEHKKSIYLLELPELDSILVHPNLPIFFIQLGDLKENVEINPYINCL